MTKFVSHQDWLAARKALLAEEKAFTKAREALSAKRRELPWVKVDKDYSFDTRDGRKTMAQLFDGRSQLVVYHFMFGPDWKEGCKSCSFWADNFNGIIAHLNQRGVTMIAISSAPLAMIETFRERMGWSFNWVSSNGTTFNQDFGVSPEPGRKLSYNFGTRTSDMDEMPGISVFAMDEAGNVYRTYSCYARGLDMMNTAYHYLDLVPKGRDEVDLPYTQSWVRHHDRY